MIRCEHFCWRFDSAPANVLSDVTLRIERGEFVVLTGASGSGKTTLGLAMCGLLLGRQPGQAAGRVLVGDLDVAAVPLHRTAELIGLVQQNPEAQFAALTVEDELAFGLENRCVEPPEIERSIRAAMSTMGVAALRDRHLSALSGGEQQRVAIASLLAARPQALILDEPTAGLDAQASHDLFRLLAGLCRNSQLTVVVIEHRLEPLLPLEPRILEVSDGGVREAEVERANRPRPGNRNQDLPLTTAAPVVEVGDVTVELDSHRALDSVSLSVHQGDCVAVMGPNGAGKTTLLQTLVGLVRPISGSVRVVGRDLGDTPISGLARSLGIVFQNADHQLVADTVEEEVLFAARRLDRVADDLRAKAERQLARAGLSDRLGDHPFRLSWGQKRRLNLISAVLHQPRLLLLDEPFSGQDYDNVGFMLDVIQAAVTADPPAACLLVTHDPKTVAQLCARVVFIADGRVIVDAPTNEAFTALRALGYEAYTPTDSQAGRTELGP